MTTAKLNLLSTPLIRIQGERRLTLPGLLAALSADQVDDFPALRPHQVPAWHMFLVQLAALALHGADRTDPPNDEQVWSELLRGLTSEFPGDEPWCLIVDDWTRPAFLQPPVPEGLLLKNDALTPDALDLLNTAKNHDLKRDIATVAEPDDWLFALISGQTGGGQFGRGNFGIVRMNSGFSSRVMFGLAPLPTGGTKLHIRPGLWFSRDLRAVLSSRDAQLAQFQLLEFQLNGGIGLTWIPAWENDQQLAIRQLNPWFIEVCRRIRLIKNEGKLAAKKGNSTQRRIQGEHLKGALADPWAPIHKMESKSLSIGEGQFDYRQMVKLLYLGDWDLPILARPTSTDAHDDFLLVAAALSRTNKTFGFQWRATPFPLPAVRSMGSAIGRAQAQEIVKSQIKDIDQVHEELRASLVIVAAGGDPNRAKEKKRKKEHYRIAANAQKRLDRKMDEIFFEHLWARLDEPSHGDTTPGTGEQNFLALLVRYAESIFESELPTIPCPSIYRLRAEARARQRFRTRLRALFPDFFEEPAQRGTQNADAE